MDYFTVSNENFRFTLIVWMSFFVRINIVEDFVWRTKLFHHTFNYQYFIFYVLINKVVHGVKWFNLSRLNELSGILLKENLYWNSCSTRISRWSKKTEKKSNKNIFY